MLNWTVDVLVDNKFDKASKEYKAILESCLMHIRNLIGFFYGTDATKKDYKRYDTDILISDFKDKNGNPFTIDDMPQRIKDICTEISYRLAHISENRLINPGKNWTEEINVAFKNIQKNMEKLKNNSDFFPVEIANSDKSLEGVSSTESVGVFLGPGA